MFEKLQSDFHNKGQASFAFAPLEKVHYAGFPLYKEVGEKLLAEGKVGCIILAGGQGTRFGCGPSKGMVPVSLIKNKSLFQLFFEKTLAAGKKAGHPLPLAIMTSPLNHQPTREFLTDAQWFGLSEETVDLFDQSMQPFLDDAGNPISDPDGKFVKGPDGNGHFFKHFFQSGIGQKWKKAGIEIVSVILIDNPLADPFDVEQCGLLAATQSEAVIKAILKSHPLEQVGTLVSDQGHPRVVEYFELPAEARESQNEEGALCYPLANTSLFCFTFDFLEKAAKDPNIELPWHFAHKTLGSMKVWKGERFIFDLLNYASKAEVLVCPREKCFSPLKNVVGDACLESVRSALLAADRAAYLELTGVPPPEDKPFELDPLFYYPTAQLRDKWKGRTFPEGDYISAEI